MGNCSATDIAALLLVGLGWMFAAAYGVAFFGTIAYFKAKGRYLEAWNDQHGDD